METAANEMEKRGVARFLKARARESRKHAGGGAGTTNSRDRLALRVNLPCEAGDVKVGS